MWLRETSHHMFKYCATREWLLNVGKLFGAAHLGKYYDFISIGSYLVVIAVDL